MSQTNNSSDSKKQSDIIIILDESGSMNTMGNEPKEAVNSFVNEQRSSSGNDGSTFSLWKFNSTVTKMIDDENLHEIKEFTCYKPEGLTALNDAIGLAIETKKSKAHSSNVVCVVISDGHENASKNYNSLQIKNMIQEMESTYKWKFVYLGANQDVYMTGNNMGVSNKRCANFDQVPGGLMEVTRHASHNVASYRSLTSQDGGADVDLDISKRLSPVANRKGESCPIQNLTPKRYSERQQTPPEAPPEAPPVVRQWHIH